MFSDQTGAKKTKGMKGVRKRRRIPGPGMQPRAMRRRRAAAAVRRGRVARRTGELKFHDVALDDAAVDSAGGITDSICKIPQGVTEKTRVGRRCTITNIAWRFNLTLPEVNAGGTPNASDVVRVILYLDKQANGATAAITDLLETADYQSFNNLSNSGRFRTLMDRTYAISYMTLATKFDANTYDQGAVDIQDSFFKSVNIPIEFDNSFSDGRIGTIRTNNLGVLLISQNGVPGFFSFFRLRFSDG